MTQFEALTAAAYAHLAEAGVEVAVVEAGLGGRWDATNVIGAPIVVLTNVGLEHTRWLGPTVTDIAREKLAVVAAPSATLVLGADLHPEAEAEARLVAERQARDDRARARRAAGRGGAAGPRRLSAAQLRRRLRGGRGLPGARWTRPPCAPRRHRRSCRGASRCCAGAAGDGGAEVVLDGAHNASGIAALAGSLPEFLAGRPLVAVLSVLDDKDAAAMLATLLPLCAGVVFTANANPRALSPATLASLAGSGRRRWVGRDQPRRGRPAPRGRAGARAGRRVWRAAARPRAAAGGRRRRARDRLDLPHRRPRAPGRSGPGIDAVNREGPSALALIAAVAVIVALVILVFFALGYGLGRMFL